MTDASIFNESHQSCFQAWLREVFQIDCEDDVETQTAPAPSPLAGSEIVKPGKFICKLTTQKYCLLNFKFNFKLKSSI